MNLYSQAGALGFAKNVIRYIFKKKNEIVFHIAMTHFYVIEILKINFKILKRKIDSIFFPIESARKLGCKVGENTILDDIDFGTEPYLVEIGNNCHISQKVSFITHDGATWVIKRKYDFKGTKYGKIIIRNNVYIGNHCIILPNVEIGSNCVIGAGSVVTKSIPSDSVFAGNPAKFICTIEEYYQKCLMGKGNLQNSQYWKDYQEFEKNGKISKQLILTNYFK